MKKTLLLLSFTAFMLASCINSGDQQTTPSLLIIPEPLRVETGTGSFSLNAKTVIVHEKGLEDAGVSDYFIDFVSSSTGIVLERQEDPVRKNRIIFQLSDDEKYGEEGYSLEVDKAGIQIEAATPAGLFYGVQTLLQVLPVQVFSNEEETVSDLAVPHCKIFDVPRFQWRGMHLDVSRHFFDVSFIKRYIDLIAMHKMNVFHWHLTDDNGWRIEIKQYPKLTEVSAWRVDREDMHWREATPPEPGEAASYGGFYTQEEIREVVEYAAKRHIEIIPEIEMPGHTSEVFAAYPDLSCTGGEFYVQPGSYWPNVDIFCAGKEETFEFIEHVLEEVMTLFPSDYIHIGGDEATKTRWENCPRCQKRIRTEGLADEHELQSWFIKRVEKFLLSNNKKLIGWDEILEGGLAPEATVMSWRGINGGIQAAEQGHDVVMSPTSHCYFDYYQANPDFEPEAIGGFLTLKKVYDFEPVPDVLTEEQEKFILGAQGNVWTEYIATPKHAEYMALPRMTALAEVVWSTPGNKDWEDFRTRLNRQFERFDALGVNYSLGSWKVDVQPMMQNGVYMVELSSEQIETPIHYTTDGSDPVLSSPVYEDPIAVGQSSVIKAVHFKDGQMMEVPGEKEIVFHKALGKDARLEFPPSKRYAARGALSVVDGLRGGDDHRSGYWLGFEGVDVHVEVDLGEKTEIDRVLVGFFQNSGAWIFLPEKLTVTLYDGNRAVVLKKEVYPEATLEVRGAIVEEMLAGFEGATARYVVVEAPGISSIPEWHEGAGNKGWLFLDEVVVR